MEMHVQVQRAAKTLHQSDCPALPRGNGRQGSNYRNAEGEKYNGADDEVCCRAPGTYPVVESTHPISPDEAAPLAL